MYAAFHDLFSAVQAIAALRGWHCLAWERLLDAVEAAGQPVESLTLGQLLALIGEVRA